MASEKYGRPISTCIKVLDMTGLKFSALNQVKVPFQTLICSFPREYPLSDVDS